MGSSDSEAEESNLSSFFITSVLTGTPCRAYASNWGDCIRSLDEPLRHLLDDLFDQTKYCELCCEPTEAHIRTYNHDQGILTINVRRVPSLKIEGENDGKIWTWHRCFTCGQIDGVPPATRRAAMSDTDLGVSFGKLLELSFSNYATGSINLASCGHSLQRDRLQYYGFGSMVVCFHYFIPEIFSVCFPSSTLNFNVSATSLSSDGASRLMVPQNSKDDIVIAVYDNEPTSIISYALRSIEYEDRTGNACDVGIEISESCNASISVDQKTFPHLRISFGDESTNEMGEEKKYSVTCYFAKQFDALRKRFCIEELDFIHSLSRCSTQGGSINAYFVKSLDERFIIKQVTGIELESFKEFATEYFEYLTDSDSLSSRIGSCLTKILGIYQVTTRHLNEEETKINVMVSENIFFRRKISRAYSIKENCLRSHSILNISDANEVLSDMNISETIHTILGNKAKRTFQNAIWNDAAFLANHDVIDYSLLVGVDEECRELVVGIIEFMTPYTWVDSDDETYDETENETTVPPKLYKKIFKNAVRAYLLMEKC